MSAKAKVQARISSYVVNCRAVGKPGQAAGTFDKGSRLDILLAAPKLGPMALVPSVTSRFASDPGCRAA
jgi:hypothetical protein